MNFKEQIVIAKALVKLFEPLAEVVIHDLKTNTIAHIEGSLSRRKPGEASMLARNEIEHDVLEVVYPKLNWDGRLIKSISIPFPQGSEPVGLMCINCDVSIFQNMKNFADSILIDTTLGQPASLFKNDWQERIHLFIHSILDEQNKNLSTLSLQDKKDIVWKLYNLGAFEERKAAADYIAHVLNMGRATIFNYLRIWRKV